MNERDYNEKSLTSYLLGSLPDEQVKKFDYWSFTNEDFSASLKAVENDLIDAYIYGELRGASLERFNSYYLSSALRREKVNFAKSLQFYAEKNIARVSSKTKNSIATKSAEKPGFLAAWRLFTNPVFRLSAAAFVLLIIALSSFWIMRGVNQPETEIVSTKQNPSPPAIDSSVRNKNADVVIQETSNRENPSLKSESKLTNKTPGVEFSRTPKSEKPATSPKIAVASFILTPPLRSGNQLPKIAFPKETTLILMTLKTESNDYKSYRVTLVDESNKKLWQSGNVRVRNETINISFSASLLKTRIYSMIVSGIRNDGAVEIISNYPFRAVSK